MNSRERLRRAYAHQEMDRPGVYSRTGFPINDPTYDRLKAYLQAHSDLKHSLLGWVAETPEPAEVVVEPHSPDFQRHITTLHTPAGDLTSSILVGLQGQENSIQESYLVKTRRDAEAYLSLPMPRVRARAEEFRAADARMGQRGIVDVHLDFNPAGFVAELCGSETFAVLSLTDRDVLHALCERRMSILLAAVKELLAEGVGPFFSLSGEEYVVPPLHGPQDFFDFNVAYDKPILDLVHDAGGRMHIHCHGSVKRVMPGFLDMGADVLHPFEAPPMGDITPAEAKAIACGRLCLEGNIQINRMYETTPEEIRAETEALVRTAFDDHRGLIVSPTASPYIRGAGEVCFAQYKAMIDAVCSFAPQ